MRAAPFACHPPSPKFYTLWAINAPLEQTRLHRQLEQFRATGLDGVVFHPRFYPGAPPYLSEPYFAQVSQAILHAKAIGLSFWLYDEDGWPSGTVGGQLLRQFPEYIQKWVGLFSEPQESSLGNFEHEGKRWHLGERRGAGVDYLNPLLCRQFIRLTYERYRDGLSPEAFEYVEAFFCDEPEFGLGHLYDALPPDGAIPWTPRLPELFRERCQADLLPLLPALFFPLAGHEEVRVHFWELLNDLFCDAFIGPLDSWCRHHGKQLTGHVKGEEHPLFQVPMVGSCQPVFRRMSLPGIDALERHPSNDFYPRQVSSVARQFGSGRCMVEAFGGAGWGASPADLERYLLWLGRHGLSDFVLHLSQYRLDSAALRDWPPSQPLHLTWSPIYAEVLGRVRAELCATPRAAADTLVVAPFRGITACYAPRELMQTNIHDAGTYPPTKAGMINTRFLDLVEALHHEGVRYDVTDERTIERSGEPTSRGVQLGACVYERVIVADDCRLTAETLSTLPVTSIAPAVISSADSSACDRWSVPEDQLRHEAIPLQWTLEKPPLNDWLLECTAEASGGFTARFASQAAPHLLFALRAVFADDIARAQLNGVDLTLLPSPNGTVACISVSSIHANNDLRFWTVHPVSRPCVWLQGGFRVCSSSPFIDGPGDTIKTTGVFTLESPLITTARDLVREGYPFLRQPISGVSELMLSEVAAALRLEELAADAVRLTVDGQDFGWTWRANDPYRFTDALAAGRHQLKIEMIPSTYNACGPHHYYRGDWFIVSPGQMAGVRNFADPVDAPEQTHGNAWHFRRFQFPVSVTPLQ